MPCASAVPSRDVGGFTAHRDVVDAGEVDGVGQLIFRAVGHLDRVGHSRRACRGRSRCASACDAVRARCAGGTDVLTGDGAAFEARVRSLRALTAESSMTAMRPRYIRRATYTRGEDQRTASVAPTCLGRHQGRCKRLNRLAMSRNLHLTSLAFDRLNRRRRVAILLGGMFFCVNVWTLCHSLCREPLYLPASSHGNGEKPRRSAVSRSSRSWTRTNDPLINSQLLYQLSYPGPTRHDSRGPGRNSRRAARSPARPAVQS